MPEDLTDVYTETVAADLEVCGLDPTAPVAPTRAFAALAEVGADATYFLAPAGLALWEEVRESGRWPDRDDATDGWLGDASHQARPSDHNPCWTCTGAYAGIVRAVDLDVDGWPAIEARDHLIELCRTGQERRLAYIISNRTIWSRTYGWAARAYDGPNPHLSHIHLSLAHDSTNFDDSPWLDGFGEGDDMSAQSEAMIKTLHDQLILDGYGGRAIPPGQRTIGGGTRSALQIAQGNVNRINAIDDKVDALAMKVDQILAALGSKADE